MKRNREFLRALAVIAVSAIIAVAAIVAHDRRSPGKFLDSYSDFTAFYCAGVVVRRHQDPYLAEPLRTCERQYAGFRSTEPAWRVTPVPFPGYALAVWAVLSWLPFGMAHLFWTFAICFSVGITAWSLARLTGFPVVLVGLVLLTPLAIVDVSIGEPTAVAAALLAFGAERAAGGAWRTSAACVALAMIEPHLVLPALLAIVLFAPAARAAVLVTSAGLALVALMTLGFATNVEYFAKALPSQAMSEVHFVPQFSLTHALSLLGLGERAAVAGGSVSYVLMLIVGILAGRRLAAVTERREFLIVVPPAVALIGGSYSHWSHIVIALIAGIAIASSSLLPRLFAFAAVLLLPIAWFESPDRWRGLVVASAVSALAAIALYCAPLRPLSRRLLAGAALAAALVLPYLALERVPRPAKAIASPSQATVTFPGTIVAGDVWAYRNSLPPYSLRDPHGELSKIPFELGLLAILAAALFTKRSASTASAPGDNRASVHERVPSSWP